MEFLVLLLSLLSSMHANAYTMPSFRDIKPQTQVMLESQNFGSPIAATTNAVLTTNAGPTSAAAFSLSSVTAQPDVPRNLTITPTGTTGDVESCVITVAGTNIFGRSISESFTFAADASTAQVGNKAFKTVTSVSWPANCESGGFAATWIIGVGEKIGLKRCMDYSGDWVYSMVAGVYESTRATVVANATNVESNTADFNGTMNGSNAFIGRFIQNFRCLP